jgi:hypothetical protein
MKYICSNSDNRTAIVESFSFNEAAKTFARMLYEMEFSQYEKNINRIFKIYVSDAENTKTFSEFNIEAKPSVTFNILD